MIERRKEPRQKSLLGGKVIFGRRQSVMDCVVSNISPHGALVVFPQVSLTPSEFMLHIPHRDETYSAKLIWRRQDRAGVSLSENERSRCRSTTPSASARLRWKTAGSGSRSTPEAGRARSSHFHNRHCRT